MKTKSWQETGMKLFEIERNAYPYHKTFYHIGGNPLAKAELIIGPVSVTRKKRPDRQKYGFPGRKIWKQLTPAERRRMEEEVDSYMQFTVETKKRRIDTFLFFSSEILIHSNN